MTRCNVVASRWFCWACTKRRARRMIVRVWDAIFPAEDPFQVALVLGTLMMLGFILGFVLWVTP